MRNQMPLDLGDAPGPATFEEHFADSPNGLPTYEEITSLEDLRDSRQVLQRLRDRDWDFVHDNTQYLSHDLHPYPAKFIPQIPGTLITSLSLPGETVLDPFGGCGTAALEAVRLGRRAVSIDANPLATLIARTKTARLSVSDHEDLRSIASTLRSRLLSLPGDPSQLVREFAEFVPNVPNMEKWFPPTSCGELALIRAHIERMESPCARDICLVALSRVVLKASFQDSETRYASKPRRIPAGATVGAFLEWLKVIVRKVLETAPELRYGVASFHTQDARSIGSEILPGGSVELIVTSPPYGNANDYHLYHRFRLFWLGFDPVALGKVEIGSHLRHQKERTGFDDYVAELEPCLLEMRRALKPGRYAALVLGDAIYEGQTRSTARALSRVAEELGFECVGAIRRGIHATKRSFLAAGRRAVEEYIVLLRKPVSRVSLKLLPPDYRMWPYEEAIRAQEIGQLLGSPTGRTEGPLKVICDCYVAANARRLTFTHAVNVDGHTELTWQRVLENGFNGDRATRKDPKYVTHGIHAYKGKFYPQLAKGLINISGVQEGAKVLDPFCGSGTTLLESHLNGLSAYGCDLHPLAVKISRAKTGVLQVDPLLVSEAAHLLLSKLSGQVPIPATTEHLPQQALGEISDWFAEPILYKLNYVLGKVRSVSTGVLQDFFEVILSDILRGVSQQDPSDLRIRRRKTPLRDADVLGMFGHRLQTQLARLERYWESRCYCPYHHHPVRVTEGDSRERETFSTLGLADGDVDLVLTSPPYATALPYIDTDRLSLILLFGMTSDARRPLEESLCGSREIRVSHRKRLEEEIVERGYGELPRPVAGFLQGLHKANAQAGVGFRRRNLPALLLRFFRDMQAVLGNCHQVLKPGSEAMVVLGDSYTMVGGKRCHIPTTGFVELLGAEAGLEPLGRIQITVTRDNHKHIRNAITSNVVLRLRRPS